MGIIEKAAEKLNSPLQKSLVQRAAERGFADLPHRPAASAGSNAQGKIDAAPSAPAASAPPAPAIPEETKRRTGRTIDIDFARLREEGFAVPGERALITEEFRLIKRPLLRNAFSSGGERIKNGHLIMVTSAQPSEGKTFTSINLALSMASEHDLTVLLIDADVVKPGVPSVLDFEADRGLVDVLVDDRIDLADVMIKTNLDNLTILPAGRSNPMAHELLASGRMSRFVEEIAKRYSDRVIIFDSPPVLATTETSVLAAHMGQVAFVIEAGRTSESAVKEAMGLISRCEHIGLILNRSTSALANEGYGYYYQGRSS